MSYVPPHLRGRGGESGPSVSAGGDRDSRGGSDDRRGGYGGRDGGRGGGYGDRDRGFGGGFDDRGRGGYGNRGGYDRSDSRGADRDRGYGGAFDDRRGGPPERGPATERTASGPRSGTEIVFADWKPSARALSMTEEQIVEIRKRLNVNVDIEEGQPGAPPPIESFEDQMLHQNILLDIRYHDYEKPTPIQAQAMPVALSGRDILGCAETGSGKTASFAIPMIQHALHQPPLRRRDGPLCLVLAPTRELAQQIEKEVKAFSRSSNMKTAIIVGGTHMGEQKADLRNGVEVVVATPGRFIDHLEQGNTSLDRVSFVVLDEADRMLDMGFEPQIKAVMRNLPERHQTLLFSATMPPEIESLAAEYLNHPVRVKVGQVSTPTANVAQHLVKSSEADKVDALLHLMLEEQQIAKRNDHTLPLTIVFVERKARCDEIADALTQEGLLASSLHGGRTQQERENALKDFREGRTPILVATDVASRGLDITGINHVINLDLPKTFEDYVHRIGRTGRAGAQGRATSFFTERDSYLTAQIRHAISEVEKGNTLAFATGREARRKDREMAAAWRKGENPAVAETGASLAAIKVEDPKLKMIMNTKAGSAPAAGCADDAWDD